MRRLAGIGVSEGVAVGSARLLEEQLIVPTLGVDSEQIPAEQARIRAAVETADQQLLAISHALEPKELPEGPLILEAHRMMLRSNELVDASCERVRTQSVAAESAVRHVVDELIAVFDRMKTPYLRERAHDVEAVGERLLRVLMGQPEISPPEGTADGIAVAANLSPSDAIHLHQRGLIGAATEGGGTTSHSAILARAMGLPYVVGVRGLRLHVRHGDMIIVDGGRGEVIVNPDHETRARYLLLREREETRRRLLEAAPTGPTCTTDGVRIELGANIESLSEVRRAVELGADSVGLFRTEFLYLDRPHFPSEEEQYQDAAATVKALGGRSATFRTLDLGGDKLPVAFQVPLGDNPSLGVRAIRFSFRRPDIFRVQLRALYRASALGPVRIMFPLVSGISELQQALEVCGDVRVELAREGTAFDPDVPLGTMLETPSAVLTTDHLAEACDFFSVGTNDLIQYAFAADRGNQDLNHLYRPLHPALLRLIRQAVDSANAAGKPLSVCGDMAGNPLFTWVLLGLGVRSFSMAPPHIPVVRSVLAATSLAEARALTTRLLRMGSEQEIEAAVRSVMHQRFGSIFGDPIDEEPLGLHA